MVIIGGRPCRAGEFRCENGPCIPDHLRCNGEKDCPLDISDELDCGPRKLVKLLTKREFGVWCIHVIEDVNSFLSADVRVRPLLTIHSRFISHQVTDGGSVDGVKELRCRKRNTKPRRTQFVVAAAILKIIIIIYTNLQMHLIDHFKIYIVLTRCGFD